MASINDVDLREIVAKAFCNVFATMFSMKVDMVPQEAAVNLQGERVMGSVGFAGKATGLVYIHLSGDFAQEIAVKLLGMKPDELGAAEINDVIGEVSNMVAGNLKSSLCDAGLTCALTTPSVTRGSSFQTETKGSTRQEMFAFKYNEHQTQVFVEVDVKPGD